MQFQCAITVDVADQVAQRNELSEQAAPFGGIEIANAESTELMMVVLQNTFLLLAHQHIDYIVDAKALAGADDTGQGHA